MNHRLDSPPMLWATMSTCRRRWATTNARIAPALTTLSWPGRAIAYTVRPSRTRRAAIVRNVAGDDSNPWTSRTGGNGAAFAGSGAAHTIAIPTSATSTLRRPIADPDPRVSIRAFSPREVVGATSGCPWVAGWYEWGIVTGTSHPPCSTGGTEPQRKTHARRVHCLRG